MLGENVSIGVWETDEEHVPNSYVDTCSQCSFATGADGGPNVLGMLQRAMMTKSIDNDGGHLEWLDCQHCPVHLASYTTPAKTGDGRKVYWKGTDVELTEMELMKIEMDGNNVDLYCDIR